MEKHLFDKNDGHNYLKLLMEIDAIGLLAGNHLALALVYYVANEQDKLWFGDARFYNEHLMRKLSASKSTLNRARTKAVQSGLLGYMEGKAQRGSKKRQRGTYAVCIPDKIEGCTVELVSCKDGASLQHLPESCGRQQTKIRVSFDGLGVAYEFRRLVLASEFGSVDFAGTNHEIPTLGDFLAAAARRKWLLDAELYYEKMSAAGWKDRDGRPVRNWVSYVQRYSDYHASEEQIRHALSHRDPDTVENFLEYAGSIGRIALPGQGVVNRDGYGLTLEDIETHLDYFQEHGGIQVSESLRQEAVLGW